MVLYGASGHAKAVYDILFSQGIKVDYLVDDHPPLEFMKGLEVFVPEKEKLQNKELIISIGDNVNRKKVYHQLKNDCHFAKAIHISSYISPFSKIGEGTVVMPKVSINAEVEIGAHAIINSGAIIEHEVRIGDFVHIAPGVSLSGNVKVGEGTLIGIGASVIPGITIGKNVKIGAGAVIIKDVPDNTVVVGIPGKIIKTNEHIYEG